MIKSLIDANQRDQIRSLFTENQKFVLVAHISPDGDALGSSLGMSFFLKELGKEATVILHDSISDNLTWAPGLEDVLFFNESKEQALEKIEQCDVIICVDFNASYRMGSLQEPVLKSSAKKMMIDHHLDPEYFCDITVSHPKVSSTCEVAFRMLKELGYWAYMTLPMAEVIYTGMMTDTGAFTYNSNAMESYYVIADLLKIGIDKDKIYDKVFNTCSENRERLKGYVLSEKMKLYKEYGASLFTLSQEELKAHNYKKGDSEGFVNMPMSIKGITFSVYFREDEEYVKVSLRSKGDIACNKFAEKYFNGGGHKNASGGEFRGTLEEAIEVFEKALPVFFGEMKK